MAEKMAEHHEVCLIGIDGSSSSEYAFDFYVEHFHRPENEVVLLHVVEPRVMSSNQLAVHINKDRQKNAEDDKQRVKNLQATYEEKMREKKIKGRISVVYYSQQPGKIISEVAKEEKCSIIVLGRKNSKSRRSSNGTIMDYLLRKCSYTVILVQQPEDAPSTPKKVTEPRYRRISCPVMSSSSFVDSDTEPMKLSIPADKPKQRRHTVIESQRPIFEKTMEESEKL